MDLNIDFGPVNPPSPKPLPKPLSPAKRNLIAFGVPTAGLLVLMMMIGSFSGWGVEPPLPTKRGQLSNSEKAVGVTRVFESYVRRSIPGLDRYLSYVDVSGSRGHLVVNLKPEFRQLDSESQEMLEASIALEWRQAKWVKEQGWDPLVEFVQHTDTEQTFTKYR